MLPFLHCCPPYFGLMASSGVCLIAHAKRQAAINRSIIGGGRGGLPGQTKPLCSALSFKPSFPTALTLLTSSPSSFIPGGTNLSGERKRPAPTADTNPALSPHFHSDWPPLIKARRGDGATLLSAACVTHVPVSPLHLRVPPEEKQVALSNSWNV